MAYTELALYCDSVAYTAVAQWAASTAYTVGQIRRQLAAPTVGNERCFVCVVAGTSGGSEPAWAISATFKGNKVTDNTVTWQECTGHPSLNGDSSNVAIWRTAAGSIAIGTVIKNTAATHYFITTTAGSGTNTEPTWNTTTGATTVDGSNTWTCLGAISSFTIRWAAPAARLQHLLNNNNSWQLNAGMTIYVGDDHNETGANSNISSSSVCQILCVDHAVALPPGPSDLRTTASFSFSSNSLIFWGTAVNGNVYGLQIKFAANTGFVAGGLGNARITFEQCLISITVSTANSRVLLGDSGSVGGQTEFRGCTFNTSAASQSMSINGAAVRMENCSLTGSFGGSANQIFSGEAKFATFIAEGCDFATNVSSGANLVGVNSSAPLGYLLFKDCKIPPDLTAIYRGGDAGMGNTIIELTRCDNGTAIYRNERHSADGTETTSTSVIRTGGASDGATSVGHQISTNANTNNYARIFNAVPFVSWNDITGTNRTVTVYGIANDSRVPNNDECWCDVEYLGSSSSPDGSYARGRALSLATAAALTADTSAWDSAATARANSTAYIVGDARKVASNSGRVFFCTAAGTSAASEPTAIAAGSATFNPSDLSSMTLSGGNLTATASASGGGVRSNAGQAAGKFYFEVLFNSFNANDMTGIALRGAVFSSFNSNATGGIGVNGALGGMYRNGLGLGTNIGAMTNGHRYCFAVDLINQLFWARLDNGNWNNNASANPANGIGGFDISAVFGSNAAFAIYVGGVSGVNATANFGGSAFTYAAPSDFSAGPAQGGYATAVDGDAIADGTAVFRAGCRFKQTLTLFSPQPAQIGHIYTFPKLGRASTTYVLDPTLELATSPLDLATLTWIAAVVSAGGSVSSGRQTAVNNLVAGLKADGVWTKLDRLWLFAAENTQSARLDLVTRATASFGGSPFPTFTTDRGYTGGGNGYIETFFNGFSSGGLYAQNSAHIGIWGNTSIPPDSNPSMGTNGSVSDYIYTRQASSGSAFWGVQDSGFTLSTTMANGLGHYIANRSASNAQQGYKNGSLINSNTTASISPPNFNTIVLGAGGQRTGIQASAAHIGGSLTSTDAGNFYTRLRAYMTAVGVP